LKEKEEMEKIAMYCTEKYGKGEHKGGLTLSYVPRVGTT